ncbi:MAG: tetratricopeptide repeat protein, partial [Acetobacteraceae bacterium]|nr:tetratricopeptide repeat protein [Acetobacteraceae bacterium]
MTKPAGPRKPPQALLTALRRIAEEVGHAANGAQVGFCDAMDAETAAARLAAITVLLRGNPLSADAWGALAMAAPEGSPLALALWQQAVAAGTLAVGPLGFLDMEGEFWGYLETRPYMRARAGLAQELWRQGRHDAAIGELQDLLRLNPNDNQGLRYRLLGWLLELGHDVAAAALHARYDGDGYAGWLYGAALLAFRRNGGDSAAARQSLRDALAGNPHLGPLLAGTVPMPKRLPEAYSPGEASEAQVAWREMQPAWAATPGALAWLGAQVAAG